MRGAIFRIELWNGDSKKIPETVKIGIQRVQDNLKRVMAHAAAKMPGWKVMERAEAVISTENEEKQIREIHNSKLPYIEFHDYHSSTKENLTVEEWKKFAEAIQPEIEVLINVNPSMTLSIDFTVRED
jgi:hypothetical protein